MNAVFGYHLDERYVDELRQVAAKRLRELFPRAKVIMVIREQIARLISHYCSDAGYGPVTSALSGDVDKFIRELAILRTGYDYDDIFNTYSSLFGRDNVLVLPFEWLHVSQDQFFDSICNFVHLEDNLQRVQSPIVNRSERLLSVVMARRLSQRITSLLPARGRHWTRSVIERALVRPVLAMRYGEHLVTPSKLSRSIIAPLIAKSNSRLNSKVDYDLGTLGYITRTDKAKP
jgi:hypothetical protein